MPVFYACQRCTACCQWPGQVTLNDREIRLIARFMRIEETEFIEQYTHLNTTRSGLSLNNQVNGACVFLKQGDCSIQNVKPQQCKDFPNLWNFPDFENFCQAVPMDMDTKTFREQVAKATGRSLHGKYVDKGSHHAEQPLSLRKSPLLKPLKKQKD
jgi:Fe-S-cluster containining protein